MRHWRYESIRVKDGFGRETTSSLRLLSDSAAGDDDFGHADYAQTLAALVQTPTRPLTIALLGTYGIGKTNIAAHLLPKMLRHDAVLAYVDLWRFEGDPLRRHLLRHLALQLDDAEALDSSYQPDTELGDLLEQRTTIHEIGFRLSPRRLLIACLEIALIACVAAVYLGWAAPSNFLQAGDHAALVGGVAIAAILALVFRHFETSISVKERQTTIGPVDAADRFEGKFKRLVASVSRSPFVIVLDNIDRCAPELALEVLTTLKTFLEPVVPNQPVFIVPCDEVALLQHLMRSRQLSRDDAQEYLRKVFTVRLPIAPLTSGDFRDFARDQVRHLSLSPARGSDAEAALLDVLSAAYRPNPRRLKQLLNSLEARLALIKQRETKGFIEVPLSDSQAFMAKLLVLEERWPGLYRDLEQDPQLYAKVIEGAELGGSDNERARTWLADEELVRFLLATRAVTTVHLEAYFTLKLDRRDAQIPQRMPFRTALFEGNASLAMEIAKNHPDSIDAYRGIARSHLKRAALAGDATSYRNVVTVMATSALRSESVADWIAHDLQMPFLESDWIAIAPACLMPLLVLGQSEPAKAARTRLLRAWVAKDFDSPALSGTAAWEVEVARGLGESINQLSVEETALLREGVERQPGQNLDVLFHIAATETGARLVASSAETSLIVGAVDASAVDGVTRPIGNALWMRVAPYLSGSPFQVFADAVATQLALVRKTKSPVNGPLLPREETCFELLRISMAGLASIAQGNVFDALAAQIWNRYTRAPADALFLLGALAAGVSNDQPRHCARIFGMDQPLPLVEALLATSRWARYPLPHGLVEEVSKSLRLRAADHMTSAEDRSHILRILTSS
jgi:hypothetical protein